MRRGGKARALKVKDAARLNLVLLVMASLKTSCFSRSLIVCGCTAAHQDMGKSVGVHEIHEVFREAMSRSTRGRRDASFAFNARA